MKPYIYAIGDVHGEYDLFQKLVAHYDPSIHQLVLLGDLNDRGPRTKECFLLGMKLVKETNAVYLRGNHEEYFLQFLQAPEDWYAPYVYYEWEEYLFVHAGVDLTKKDWRQTSDRDFLWIREPFHTGKNNTGKMIVFGHTITPMLYGDMQTTDLWYGDNLIGIDGGAVFGGSLHGVVFDQSGIVQDIEYQNNEGSWRG